MKKRKCVCGYVCMCQVKGQTNISFVFPLSCSISKNMDLLGIKAAVSHILNFGDVPASHGEDAGFSARDAVSVGEVYIFQGDNTFSMIHGHYLRVIPSEQMTDFIRL